MSSYIGRITSFLTNIGKQAKMQCSRGNIFGIMKYPEQDGGGYFISIFNNNGIEFNSMAYGTRTSNVHSQGLSSNPYPEPNQSNSSY